MATIYEVMAYIANVCIDGRSNHGAWGHQKQFHTTRESAESACRILRAGDNWGCQEPPRYEVVERTRQDFPGDDMGEQEWRRACKQAGLSREEALA